MPSSITVNKKTKLLKTISESELLLASKTLQSFKLMYLHCHPPTLIFIKHETHSNYCSWLYNIETVPDDMHATAIAK